MIFSLIGTLIGLALALWVALMFAWWRKEQEQTHEISATAHAAVYWEKTTRLMRRGFYGSELLLKHAMLWSNKKFASFFFKVFPSAEQAFAKRDLLAGLKHGPSSYFLLTITEDQKKPRRRRTA